MNNDELIAKYEAGELEETVEDFFPLISAYFAQKKPEQVIKIYEETGIKPFIDLSGSHLWMVGISYYDIDNYEMAVRSLDTDIVKKEEGNDSKYLYILGYSYYQIGNYEVAFNYFNNEIVKENNKTRGYYYWLVGSCFYNLNKYEQALLYFNNEILKKEKSTDADYLWAVATCYYKIGDDKKSLNYLNNKILIEAIKDDPAYYWNKAICLLNLQEFEQALECLNNEVLVKDKIHDPDYLFIVGQCFLYLEKFEQALEFLNNDILKKDKINDFYYLWHLGYCFFELDDYQKALEYFNNDALKHEKMSDSYYLMCVAICYLQLKRYEFAYQTLSKKIVKEKHLNNPSYLFYLGLCHIGLKQYTKGIHYLEHKEVKNEFCEDYEYLDVLAQAYLADKQCEKALLAIKEKYDGTKPSTSCYYGEIKHKSANRNDFFKYLESVNHSIELFKEAIRNVSDKKGEGKNIYLLSHIQLSEAYYDKAKEVTAFLKANFRLFFVSFLFFLLASSIYFSLKIKIALIFVLSLFGKYVLELVLPAYKCLVSKTFSHSSISSFSKWRNKLYTQFANTWYINLPIKELIIISNGLFFIFLLLVGILKTIFSVKLLTICLLFPFFIILILGVFFGTYLWQKNKDNPNFHYNKTIKLLEKEDVTPDNLLFLAKMYYFKREYEKSLMYAKRSLDMESRNIREVDIYELLGRIAFRTKNHTTAVDMYKKALEILLDFEKNNDKNKTPEQNEKEIEWNKQGIVYPVPDAHDLYTYIRDNTKILKEQELEKIYIPLYLSIAITIVMTFYQTAGGQGAKNKIDSAVYSIVGKIFDVK